MGEGILGWEADFAWGGSDFFEREVFTSDVFNLDPNFDANLSSFMGNVLVGVPIGGTTGGGVRPYFVGGIGLVTHSVQSNDDSLFDFDESSSNFGFDVGGGVMGFATDTIGFRGDIRYYRGFTDVNELRDEFNIDLDLVDDIDFWRATGGVTFRW
jgi:opacity protein-like surface antigen